MRNMASAQRARPLSYRLLTRSIEPRNAYAAQCEKPLGKSRFCSSVFLHAPQNGIRFLRPDTILLIWTKNDARVYASCTNYKNCGGLNAN